MLATQRQPRPHTCKHYNSKKTLGGGCTRFTLRFEVFPTELQKRGEGHEGESTNFSNIDAEAQANDENEDPDEFQGRDKTQMQDAVSARQDAQPRQPFETKTAQSARV